MSKQVLIGFTKAGNSWNASALGYPGCVAAGDSFEEVKQLMAEALEMHIAGMLEDGEELPEDISDFAIVDVPVNVPEKVGN